MKFREFIYENQLDQIGSNPVVYHVTYLKNLDGILNSKLVSRGGFSPWRKQHIQDHSEKGNFFCKTLQCAKNWVGKMMDQAFHISDEPIDDGVIPVIIKFRLNKNSWKPDLLGSVEVEHSYYTPKNIDSKGIKVWNGSNWSADYESADNLVNLVDDEDFGHEDGNYPFPHI